MALRGQFNRVYARLYGVAPHYTLRTAPCRINLCIMYPAYCRFLYGVSVGYCAHARRTLLKYEYSSYYASLGYRVDLQVSLKDPAHFTEGARTRMRTWAGRALHTGTARDLF